jgi:hypothetical protein
LVLFTESFAATNEREGAEIAHAIVRALLEARVKVIRAHSSNHMSSCLCSAANSQIARKIA